MKVEVSAADCLSVMPEIEHGTQEFLDSKQYNLKDIGSGVGGCCALIADKFQATVLGIDLSGNMVESAKYRYKMREDLTFKIQDCMTAEFEENSFDVIHSRDSIIHISENKKQELFIKMFKWMTPGGQVVITDYFAPLKDTWTPEFAAYVQDRGYTLLPVERYGEMLTNAGFEVTRCEYLTEEFIEVLKEEEGNLRSKSEEFIKEFSVDDLNNLLASWRDKISRAEKGLQLWGCVNAVKPFIN